MPIVSLATVGILAVALSLTAIQPKNDASLFMD